MKKTLQLTITTLFVFVAGIFITAPDKYMQSFMNGLTIWAFNVLPALFPFIAITTVSVKFFPENKRSFTGKLFKINCDSIFITSLLCGYPVGAKAIADCETSADVARRMSSFCSSASPVFLIATVGTKMLKNARATVILFIAHYLALFINGIIFTRGIKERPSVRLEKKFRPSDIGDIITNSALSVISVGGLIALFYMLTDMFKSFLPQSAQDSVSISFVIGLFEMTNGIINIAQNANVIISTVLCSGLLSFGGMCVFAQCYAYLGKRNVKAFDVLKMKTAQSATATIVSFVLGLLFLRN